jgi:hypothetical protein
VSVEEARTVLAAELKAAESGRREAEGEAGRARGELWGRELEVAKLRKTVRDNQAVLEAERKRYSLISCFLVLHFVLLPQDGQGGGVPEGGGEGAGGLPAEEQEQAEGE